MLHQFMMSREESMRLKDIEERLLAIREENERRQSEPAVRKWNANRLITILLVNRLVSSPDPTP